MQARILLLGATGAIGQSLLPRLAASGLALCAVSRQPQPGTGAGAVDWRRLDLAGPPPAELPPFDAILSAGPLDLAARWLAACPQAPRRVVAFSSTSASSKAASSDVAERTLAARLRAAEAALIDWADARGVALTLLRPTLVYGMALDRNLSRLAALAARLGWIAIPRGAVGLRQPVHADDLAAAAALALSLPRTPETCYALPGGETLDYRSMVRRVLDALEPRPRLLELPLPLLSALLGAAQAGGRLRGVSRATLLRTREDLVFDATAARRDLDWQPRKFAVDAGMLATEAATA